MHDPKHNTREIMIVGFGTCMISGYPHDNGGFFKLACEEIATKSEASVTSAVHSFGGFPAPRAAKYLERRALSKKPDFVIIQLGTLDALCPVRPELLGSARSKNLKTKIRNSTENAQLTPASNWSYPRWILAAFIGFAFQLQPTTPLPQFIAAIDGIIDQCLAAGAIPIVLTPFVYGSLYSMRSGVRYANALRELVAQKTGAILVDAMLALWSKPRRETLQHDGFHLSKVGHALVASAIANAVCKSLQERDGPVAAE